MGDDNDSADYIYGWYQYTRGIQANPIGLSEHAYKYRIMGWKDAAFANKIEQELAVLNYLGER